MRPARLTFLALILATSTAGCAGNSTGALPAAGTSGISGSGSIVGIGTKLNVQEIQQQLLKQIKAHTFPLASLRRQPLSPEQARTGQALLGYLHSLGPHGTSNSIGKPGGFGFHTQSGGPYTGIFALDNAYDTSQFGLIAPTARTSTILAPGEIAPNGTCFITYVSYKGNGPTVKPPIPATFANSFVTFDVCNKAASFSISLPSPYALQQGNGPPMIASFTQGIGSVPCSPCDWFTHLYNWSTGSFDQTGFQTGVSSLTFGGSLYYDDLARGPCPPLPPLSSHYISLYNPTTVSLDLLAPSMNGGTYFTAFAPPDTSKQTCFANDGRISPFYTVSHDNSDWQVSMSFP